MVTAFLWIGGAVLALFLFYRHVQQKYSYFKKRNIPFLKPLFFIGSTGGMFFKRSTTQEHAIRMYKNMPNEKVYGYFSFLKPMLMARCPEFLKTIAIKDSDHFSDHQAFMDRETDDLFANCIIFQRGEKWRDMRATLSPAFTGSKIRLMFKMVAECAENMVTHYVERSKRGEHVSCDVKELFSRCANDIIATCAFGVQVNSFENQTNEFFMTGKRLLVPRPVRFLTISLLPRLMEMLNVSFIENGISNYFRSLVLDTMAEREKNNVYRPDMINIMMQIRKGQLTRDAEDKNDEGGFANVTDWHADKRATRCEWTDNELIAQCFIFFLAGFESSSLIMAALAYEISLQPDIQERLYKEIKATQDKLPNKTLDYDSLQSMKYLDQVVCETLRKWSPLPISDRHCVKDYVYDDGVKQIRIEKGMTVSVPIHGFHYDPKYFPNPEKFDPERFSDENKGNIVPGTYIPFGIGPRNCIGTRFALQQVKISVCALLSRFKFVPNARTQIPIKLKKDFFVTRFERGVDLDLILRD